ncbi:MAG: hypothetical protein H0W36_05055 [Gemmatimonadetes bacterium]|nr:hypothetical protein [Gemmatimonadota bacterium]
MATRALALRAETSLPRPPRAAVLWTLAAAGCAAAAGMEAGLRAWITASYVFAGLVAWWRRPESRLGMLISPRASTRPF